MKTNHSVRKSTLATLFSLAVLPAMLHAGNPAKSLEQYGIIKSVDSKLHQIVVDEPKTKNPATYRWNDQTKFSEQGKVVSAEALKVGLSVHLKYADVSGSPLLESVQLTPGKEHKAGAAAPSAKHKS